MKIDGSTIAWRRLVPKFRCRNCDSNLLELRVTLNREVTVHCIACARTFPPTEEARNWALKQERGKLKSRGDK